jgi:hypothetical protein
MTTAMTMASMECEYIHTTRCTFGRLAGVMTRVGSPGRGGNDPDVSVGYDRSTMLLLLLLFLSVVTRSLTLRMETGDVLAGGPGSRYVVL